MNAVIVSIVTIIVMLAVYAAIAYNRDVEKNWSWYSIQYAILVELSRAITVSMDSGLTFTNIYSGMLSLSVIIFVALSIATKRGKIPQVIENKINIYPYMFILSCIYNCSVCLLLGYIRIWLQWFYSGCYITWKHEYNAWEVIYQVNT